MKQDTGMEYTGKTRKLYPRNGANQGMTNLMDFKQTLVQVKKWQGKDEQKLDKQFPNTNSRQFFV